MRALLTLLFFLPLAGCGSWGFPGVYRINVEQGNIVTGDIVGQLKPGMSRRQVRYILGTPLIEDSFNRDRQDYVYMLRNGNRVLREERLTVYFQGDAMTRFTSSVEAAAKEPASDSGDKSE